VFADAVARIRQSIFPIFYSHVQDGRPSMGVSGTGFFTGPDGTFVTVDHIMRCAPPGSTHYYYGNVPDRLSQPTEIEHVASDSERDLYLGHVARDFQQPVALAADSPRPGDYVCLCGYPMAVLSVTAQGGFVGNVRQYWQPTFVIDDTQAVIEGMAYDGYIVANPCYSGMSGGPVFDIEANVRGIAAATLTRTIPELGGDPSIVKNGIVVDVKHIKAFLKTYSGPGR
jgi:S1-C subfamily serine protease